MKNRNIVKQDYNLVNAKYKLTSSEIKFIMTAIAQIDANDKEFQEYEIKVSELEQKLQSEQNETRLKQFAKKLLQKPLEIPTSGGWIVANWFADIEYIRGQAKFKVSISKKLKPYLLELKKRFVKYNLKYILPLSSNYSIRLYQLLKEYEKLTKRIFTVQELQEILQVPKSLKRYSQFKQKVLKVAEQELIEHCDIFFEYEEIKEVRKVVKILFRIKKNQSKIESSQGTLFYTVPDYFSRFYGREILTEYGTKTVVNIHKHKDGYQINYLDGSFSRLALKSEVLFALGEVDEFISLSDIKKILNKKVKKWTKKEAELIKKYKNGDL